MTVVVGVDGSEESLRALRWSVEEARLRRARVRAVYVWRLPFSAAWGDPYLVSSSYDASYEVSEREAERVRKLAVDRLAGIVAGVDTTGVEVEQRVVEGHPSEVLVEASKDAELLVVGSRGHGGFAGLLLGSVSQACVHHACCPVMIFRRSSS